MAAQKQKTQQYKMKNIQKYRRKIKSKTIKSKSEYASEARPNGSLIYIIIIIIIITKYMYFI